MNEIKQAPRPMMFFWATAFMVVVGLLWSAFCFVDLLLHPLHAVGFVPIPVVNLLSGVIVGPLTIGVGAVILRRQPRNVVGLLIMLIGEAWLAGTLRSDLDVAWVQIINYFFASSLWTALFLLVPYFPDGRIYPPRYARVVHAIALYFFVFGWLLLVGNRSVVTSIQGSVPIEFDNPFFIPALEPINNLLVSIGQQLTFGLLGFGLFLLIRRLRTGDAHLRAQIRWLMWNMALFAVFAVVGFSFRLFTIATPLTTAFSVVFFTWLLFFPLIGISYAILRHRLYDIDIIIRRTLIYTVLTGILAALYFGAIILTQQVFRAATGQTSDLAIVVSTLLIAALFSPIRRRVQDGIDRRLYRRKYDVEQTLADFQKNLREDVDMETLQANLIGVVSETMQPDKIALWVKE